MTVPESEMKISGVCVDIKELLINKNRKYGNSALKPCRVFSKASAVEQLLVRIDDKLNRIMQGAGLLADDEDVVVAACYYDDSPMDRDGERWMILFLRRMTHICES